jgi:hypothetical protein
MLRVATPDPLLPHTSAQHITAKKVRRSTLMLASVLMLALASAMVLIAPSLAALHTSPFRAPDVPTSASTVVVALLLTHALASMPRTITWSALLAQLIMRTPSTIRHRLLPATLHTELFVPVLGALPNAILTIKLARVTHQALTLAPSHLRTHDEPSTCKATPLPLTTNTTESTSARS